MVYIFIISDEGLSFILVGNDFHLICIVYDYYLLLVGRYFLVNLFDETIFFVEFDVYYDEYLAWTFVAIWLQ